METLLNARAKQLEEQKEIDAKLRECPCRDLVSDYLFDRREKNREQYKAVRESSFFHTYKVIQKNLDENTKDQEKIKKILQSKNPCQELEDYMHPKISVY